MAEEEREAEDAAEEKAEDYTRYLHEKARDFDQIMRTATIRHSAISYVEIIQVIKVVSVLGLGIESSPVRQVTEYFDFDGTQIARQDPVVDTL